MLPGGMQHFRVVVAVPALLVALGPGGCAPGVRGGITDPPRHSARGDDARSWRMNASKGSWRVATSGQTRPGKSHSDRVSRAARPEPAPRSRSQSTSSEAAGADGEITMAPLELDGAGKRAETSPERGHRHRHVHRRGRVHHRSKHATRPRTVHRSTPIARGEPSGSPASDERVDAASAKHAERARRHRHRSKPSGTHANRPRRLEAKRSMDERPVSAAASPAATGSAGGADRPLATLKPRTRPATDGKAPAAAAAPASARQPLPREPADPSSRRRPATDGKAPAAAAAPASARQPLPREPADPSSGRRPPDDNAFVRDAKGHVPRQKVDEQGQVIDDEDPL